MSALYDVTGSHLMPGFSGAALRGQNADSADLEGDDDAKDEAMEE